MNKNEFQKLPYEEKKKYIEILIQARGKDLYPLLVEDGVNQYEPFPLSDIQEAYFVGKQIGGEGNKNGCHIYYEFEVENLDAVRLQEAWNVLVSHHNILRDMIMPKGKQRIQQNFQEYKILVYDMSGEKVDTAREKQNLIRDRLSHKVYQTEDFPLYEISITKLPGRISVVHFSMDEWIMDASSIAILFKQWYKLYYDRNYQLEELKLTYRDYIMAQKKFEASKKFQSDLAYWKNIFSGIDPKAFSYLKEGADKKRTRYYHKFPKEIWAAVNMYANSKKVSPTSCLLSAFLTILNRRMDEKKYPVILTVLDRMGEHPDLQKVIGPFITTLYYVEDEPELISMEQKVIQVQKKLWEITDHRSASGIRILRELKKEKYLDTDYSVPIVFTSMISSVKDTSKESWYYNVTYSITQTPQVYLDCQVMEEENTLVLHWDVQEDRFPDGMIASLFHQYTAEIDEMAEKTVFRIDKKVRLEEWDLTVLQKSYWLLQSGNRATGWGGMLYQEFDVSDDSASRLKERWKEIAADTSMLHSVFTNKGMQKMVPLSKDYMQCFDLKQFNENEKVMKLEGIREQLINQKFSLFQPPRCLLNILEIEENKLRVCFAVDPAFIDGQSLGILYRRLFKKDCRGECEKVLFSSYLSVYKKNQEQKTIKNQILYWEEKVKKLSDGPFKGRTKIGENIARRKSIRLSCFSLLVQYAAIEDVSLDAVLLGVYQVILSEWDSNNNFTIVNVSWDRPKTIPSIEKTIGDFTNIDWFTFDDKADDIMECVKNISTQIRQSKQNREISSLEVFAKQKKNLWLPVIYTSLVKQKEAELPSNVRLGYGVSKTPNVILDMICFVEEGTLIVNWDYDANIFTGEEITSRLKRYEMQLTALLERKHLRLKAMTNNNWDKRCIHQYVELKAEVQKDRTAVKMKEQQLTYQELNESANMLAGFLIDKGVEIGDFVGICLDKSVEMIVVILAVLKAGAAYVPMDPVYPRDRILYMVDDCRPKLLITSKKAGEKLKEADISRIVLDSCRNEIIKQSTQNPEVNVTGENAAYIIYTSGSTGRPKGVIVTHWNVVRLFSQTENWFHFTANDVWTMYHSFAFDFSVWEIWGALLFGGRLLVVPYEVSRSFQEFYTWLAKEKVTVLNQTPTAFNQLLKAEGEIGVKDLSIRYIIFGGEALHFKNLKAWYERHGEQRTQLVNMYGITETTVHVTYRPISRKDVMSGQSLIGECIPDMRIYLLDDSLHQVKAGEIGELCVSGAGLTKGYLNRPDITKEKFRENPFGEGQLYLSGDLGRYTQDGEIEYIGRKDNQVKIRGFRIELGEIESVLVSHPHIEQAAVIVDKSGKEPRLKAYLLTDKTAILESEIRKFVRQKLPDYMVPNMIQEVSKIGLTINGKLDYKKIQDAENREFAEEKGTSEHMEINMLGREKLKNAIHQIIKEELESDWLDEKEDIFNLGGTSLTIVNVAKRVSEELNAEVPVDIFLENPVIEEITEYILNKSSHAAVIEEKNYKTIDKETFSRLFGLLKKETIHGKTCYLYASAGGKYAVQVYVYVKENGVEGVSEGLYYYHPEEHSLYYISEGKSIDAGIYANYYRPVYNRSSFAVYFIAQLSAIEPVYLDFSEGLVTVDSGYMKQLFLMSREAKNLGLIGVDTIDFECIKAEFELDQSHICLSGMLGGNNCTEQQFELPDDWTGEKLIAHLQTVPIYLSKEKQEELIRNMKYNQLSKRVILELAKKKLHIRKFRSGTSAVMLDPVRYEEQRYINRSSKRIYEERIVTKGDFLGLLAGLMQDQDGKYSYPSVGNLYFVKVYVYVKKDAVEGFEEGVYFYNQKTGILQEVNLSLDEKLEYCYTPFNRPHYKLCKFCIFLAFDAKEAERTYCSPYLKYALCEAGAIGQVLMNSQADFGLGLVPIGGMNFDKLYQSFGLTENHMMIHSFMGGAYEYKTGMQAEENEYSKVKDSIKPTDKRSDCNEIAIIGMSGKFPMADSVMEFWDNLAEGKNCIIKVPESRWHNSGEISYGGFIRNVEAFDPQYFNIAPEEAMYLDPQARLFLTAVNEAFYDAGYQFTEKKEEKKVGVFVGSMYQQYHLLAKDNENEDIMAIQSYSSIANRTSYYFNFTGPSIAVDTACSSAITALSMACASIRSGETGICVAGGINLTLHPSKYSALKKMGLLSNQNETKCFGDGDGFIPGEGVGVLILKDRVKAEQDGDHIYALIKGIQISHSGKTKAYSMPSTSMEQSLIENTLNAANITAGDIDYVECAANGTCLADAAEYNALKQIFAGSDKNEVLIGSVKSNIGHLEAASGMAQIIKVLLQFRYKKLVPTICVDKLNTMIQEKNSKLSIVKENKDWKSVSPFKMVLIDTFAAGGTNACTVLAEYDKQKKGIAERKEYVILLSANSPEELKTEAASLKQCVRRPDLDLMDLEYTLSLYKSHLPARAVILCSDKEELITCLECVENGKEADKIYKGFNREDSVMYRLFKEEEKGIQIVEGWVKERNIRALSELWAHGIEIDWRKEGLLAGGNKIFLRFPFFQDRNLWVDGAASDDVLAIEKYRNCNAEESKDAHLGQIHLLLEIMQIEDIDISLDTTLQSIGFNSIYAIKYLALLKDQGYGAITIRDIMMAETLGDIKQIIWKTAETHH